MVTILSGVIVPSFTVAMYCRAAVRTSAGGVLPRVLTAQSK